MQARNRELRFDFWAISAFSCLAHWVRAPDPIQIKEDEAVEQGLGGGLVDPLVEIRLPDAQGLTPFGIDGHDPPLAVAVTTFIEPVADELRQGFKVGVVLRRVIAVVQDHGVVLVGDDQLLLARHGTQGKEAVGNRRRPQGLLGQLQQALLETAPDERHGAADHP